MTSRKIPESAVENLVSDLEGKVDKTSNQTIGGIKTFDASTATARTDVYIASQASDTNTWSGSLVFKKGDLNTGFCESFLNSGAPTNDAVIQLTAHHTVNGTEHYANLVVGVRGSDGSTYALAPTPSVADNNQQIATTAYVNSKMQVVSALPANPDPNVFYFIPE